jgi:hypothetical protein
MKTAPPSRVRGARPWLRQSRWTYDATVWDRWFSRRALLLHLALSLVVAGCCLAAWWQATRALGGNGLSWFYTFEWPAFALIAIAAWWHLIHEDPEARAARKSPSSAVDRSERKAEW